MDILRPVRRFDSYQQRHRWLAVPLAVVKKFSDDQGGSLAAIVAYYSFFSLFPLLLVFVTILGFVLQGDSAAQESIKNSVLAQFPIIGKDIKVGSLHGRTVALVLGLLTSLLSGLGITQAAQNAFDTIWAVPFKDLDVAAPGDFNRQQGIPGIGQDPVLRLLRTAQQVEQHEDDRKIAQHECSSQSER